VLCTLNIEKSYSREKITREFIGLKYKDTVVSIVSKLTLSDGSSECKLGTGFIINPDGYIISSTHLFNSKNGNVVRREIYGSIGSAENDCNKYNVGQDSYKLEWIDAADSHVDVSVLTVIGRAFESDRYNSVRCEHVGFPDNGTDIYSIGFHENTGPIIIDGSFQSERIRGSRGKIKVVLEVNSGQSGSPVFSNTGGLIGVIVEEIEGLDESAIISPISLSRDMLFKYGKNIETVDSLLSTLECLKSRSPFTVKAEIVNKTFLAETQIRTSRRFGVSTGSVVDTKCKSVSIAPTSGWTFEPASATIVGRITKGSNSAAITKRAPLEIIAKFCARSVVKGFRKKTGDSFGSIRYTESRKSENLVQKHFEVRSNDLSNNIVSLPIEGEYTSIQGEFIEPSGAIVKINGLGDYDKFRVYLSNKLVIIERI